MTSFGRNSGGLRRRASTARKDGACGAPDLEERRNAREQQPERQPTKPRAGEPAAAAALDQPAADRALCRAALGALLQFHRAAGRRHSLLLLVSDPLDPGL